MSMGLVVLIIWLLNITEHHCVNTPNSNSFRRVWFGDRIVYVDKTKKAVAVYVTASSFMWTS